jgi:hypothetical protein
MSAASNDIIKGVTQAFSCSDVNGHSNSFGTIPSTDDSKKLNKGNQTLVLPESLCIRAYKNQYCLIWVVSTQNVKILM